MSVQFPPQFKNFWSESGIKKAFVSEIKARNNHDCPNCGGVGTLHTFVAHEGPYKSPSTDISKASHFFDGAWWVGSSYSANCPVCQGHGQVKTNGR